MSDEECCLDCGSRLAPELNGACPACLWGECVSETDGLTFGDEIARGGMGIVYRARQSEPNRVVAVKMLLPHLLDDPGLRERFANEARAAASLDHPGILPVYAVGERGGVPYFTMKLADDGSLADRLRVRGVLPPREAAALLAELAEAIAHAHRRGVLHRDLKPANILFDTTGRAYVSDFGLAKVADFAQDADLTRTSALLGTLHYLPPEVASGTLREASTAGDIYSLGATLHQILCGRPPFEADSGPALLRKIADTEPEPIAALPRDLAAILSKCLKKQPDKRYPLASALAEDLRAWLTGRTITARHPRIPERVWRQARRHPTMATLGVALIGALLAGSLLQLKANAQLSESLADALLATASAVRQQMDGSARLRTLELIRRSLTAWAPDTAEGSARLRGETASALALPGLDVLTQWPVFGSWNHVSPVFTDDLHHYAAPSEDGGFGIWDTATHTLLRSFPPPVGERLPPAHFGFDPMGSYVIVTSVDMGQWRCRTGIHAIDGTFSRGPFGIAGVDSAVPVLFPDGSFLQVRDDGRCWRWPIGSEDPGEAFHLTSESGVLLGQTLSLSPDGRNLAGALSQPDGIAVWDVAEQRLLWTSGLLQSPRNLTWSPDGERLACAEDSSAIVVLNALSGEVALRLEGHRSSIASMAFHPSGDSIASVSYDGWLLWQGLARGDFRTRILANAGPLTFSKDGRQLGFSAARGTLGLARVTLPIGWRPWSTTADQPVTVTCAESTRDGRHLAIATLDGLELWDAESTRRIDFHPWETEVRWPWFRVSPTGAELVCSDSDMMLTRWPISATGFGDPVTVPSKDGNAHIIQDFSTSGEEWLVSGDREQRETSSQTNFYVWPNGDSTKARLVASNVIAVGLSFVPPSTRYAIGYHSHLPDAHVWDCESARTLRPLGHDEPIFLSVSPAGARACTIGANEGKLWETNGWSLLASWDQRELGKTTPQFSPRGTYVATITPAGRVSIRQASDGSLVLDLDPPVDISAALLVWLGETKLLLVSTIDGLWEWDLTKLGEAAESEGISWSRHGEQ